MENKKDIGKAFRERLKGLERSPNENLWTSIEAELSKKKKRRIAPFFWFTSSGIAIGIMILLGVFTEPLWKDNLNFENNKNLKKIHNEKFNEAGFEENKKTSSKKENTLFLDKEEKVRVNKPLHKTTKKVSEKEDDNYSFSLKSLEKSKKSISQKNKLIYKNKKREKKLNFEKEIFISDNNINNPKHSISDDSLKMILSKTEMEIVSENTINNDKDTLLKLKKEKNIEIKMFPKKKKDSIVDSNNGVYVFVHGSPTLFHQASKKSPFDNRLDAHRTNSEIVFNYGGYIGFYGSEKWSVRIGINNTQLNLKTDNIQIATLNGNPIISGKFNSIEQHPGLTNQMIASELNDSIISLHQKLSYLEIPMEFKYKFYTKKDFQLDMIGGLSTLYLKKNDIVAESRNGNSMKIGNNPFLKSISLSANLGFGISYKLNNKLQINIEPIFKYYFNNAENDIKTYSLNLQAGLQYNFYHKK